MSEYRLLRPASFWATVPVAFALGLAYAIILFGPGFALGTSDYWRLPQGAIGGLEDMKTVMSGYYWLVQDAWRWPLLHFVQTHGVAGANAALLDCVPILALVAKIIRSLTGMAVDLCPLWAFGMLGNMRPGSVTVPFGVLSMNLLAPFWPQTSGALNWTGLYLLTRGSIRGTTVHTSDTANLGWAPCCR